MFYLEGRSVNERNEEYLWIGWRSCLIWLKVIALDVGKLGGRHWEFQDSVVPMCHSILFACTVHVLLLFCYGLTSILSQIFSNLINDIVYKRNIVYKIHPWCKLSLPIGSWKIPQNSHFIPCMWELLFEVEFIMKISRTREGIKMNQQPLTQANFTKGSIAHI